MAIVLLVQSLRHKIALGLYAALLVVPALAESQTTPSPPNAPVKSAPVKPGQISASRPLTLLGAVHTALAQNLRLRAGGQLVAAGRAEVDIARSGLLPQVEFGLSASSIDADRASAGFGRLPQHRSLATLEVEQNIYSDTHFARHAVAKMLQEAREIEQEERGLDTVLGTAIAYLDLLRAENLARIQEENLRLSESNYERAQSRLELGVANRAEVYRFETQRAAANVFLSEARALVTQQRITLNQTMNQPLGDQYRALGPNLQSLVSQQIIRDTLANPARRGLLGAFFVVESTDRSPELRRLRKQIDAEARVLTAVQRSLYLPTLTADATLDQELGRGGAGQDQFDFGTGIDGPQFGGRTNKTEWEVRLEANLALYQGGSRYSQRTRQQREIDALRLHYDEALIRIQASAMRQFEAAAARYDQIAYASIAANASANNFRLVRESHERGIVPIIDLIDAQVTGIRAEQAAANALYDFLVEYMRLQRISGQFDLVANDEERSQYRARLEKFIGP